jgi:hypothetical protein
LPRRPFFYSSVRGRCRLGLGKLAALDGDPGLGKSMAALRAKYPGPTPLDDL